VKPSNVLLVFLVCCGTAFGAGSDTILTPGGLGPVKVGMTLREASQALGVKLKRESPNDPDSKYCDFAHRADGNDSEINYMIKDGHIARIDVGDAAHERSIIKTAEGVGLGSTERAVKKAYGRALKVEPHPYGDGDPDGWHYLVIDEPGHKRGIIFETDGRKVTSFRAGEYPALGYIEGCS